MKLCEIVDVNLVNTWWNTLPYAKKRSYGTRDNCGPASYAFVEWAKENMGLDNLMVVSGKFRADNVMHDKADFTKAMKKEFKLSGLDFNNPNDRKSWIEQSKYNEPLHYIPHMWVMDGQTILDPSGNWQFIKSGFSTDLNTNRYIIDDRYKLVDGKWNYHHGPRTIMPWEAHLV